MLQGLQVARKILILTNTHTSKWTLRHVDVRGEENYITLCLAVFCFCSVCVCVWFHCKSAQKWNCQLTSSRYVTAPESRRDVCEASSAVLHCSLVQTRNVLVTPSFTHTHAHTHSHTHTPPPCTCMNIGTRTRWMSRCTNRRNHIDIPPASWALVTPPWLSLIVWIRDEYTHTHTLNHTPTCTQLHKLYDPHKHVLL